MTRRGVMWLIVGILGLACAVAVAWSASTLASQHIGLASAPVSVVRGLAPTDRDQPSTAAHGARHPTRPRGRGSSPAATHSQTSTRTASATTQPVQTSPVAPATSTTVPAAGSPTGTTAPPSITPPATGASSSGGSVGAGQGTHSGGGPRDDSSGAGSGGASQGPDD